MGSSTSSTLVAADARLSSMAMKLLVGMEWIMLVDGIITGGGVAMWMGDDGTIVVTPGDDIVFLSASSARTAF